MTVSKKRLDFEHALTLLFGHYVFTVSVDVESRVIEMEKYLTKTSQILAAAMVFGMSLLIPTSGAQAQASNCQADFQKVMGPRQALIERINGFRNKKPTASQACSTLGQLVSADGKLVKWMTDNKDWCQIPDQLIEQVQGSTAQASRSRSQACGAAKNQQAQIARARSNQARAQQGGAPAVGSGVRLPQGAL